MSVISKLSKSTLFAVIINTYCAASSTYDKDAAFSYACHAPDVDLAINSENPPLVEACYHGDIRTIRILLARKAAVDTCDLHGYTPLIIACMIREL